MVNEMAKSKPNNIPQTSCSKQEKKAVWESDFSRTIYYQQTSVLPPLQLVKLSPIQFGQQALLRWILVDKPEEFPILIIQSEIATSVCRAIGALTLPGNIPAESSLNI